MNTAERIRCTTDLSIPILLVIWEVCFLPTENAKASFIPWPAKINLDSPTEKPNNFPAMIHTTTIPASDVSDLDFVRVHEDLRFGWSTFEVQFKYDGREYVGFLDANPNAPTRDHAEQIEDCEPA